MNLVNGPNQRRYYTTRTIKRERLPLWLAQRTRRPSAIGAKNQSKCRQRRPQQSSCFRFAIGGAVGHQFANVASMNQHWFSCIDTTFSDGETSNVGINTWRGRAWSSYDTELIPRHVSISLKVAMNGRHCAAGPKQKKSVTRIHFLVFYSDPFNGQ